MADEEKEQAPDVEIEPIDDEETEDIVICPECGNELEDCICEEV